MAVSFFDTVPIWTFIIYTVIGSIEEFSARTTADLEFEVVVARYNEDLSWLEAAFSDATVYNKDLHSHVSYLFPSGWC